MTSKLPARLSFLKENDADPAPIIFDYFKVPLPNLPVLKSEIRNVLENETPQQRLKSMYNIFVKDEISEELKFCITMPLMSGMIVMGITSALGASAGRERFIERNKATRFETHFKAARANLDTTFVSGLRMGFKWFMKTTIFSGIFCFTSTSIAVYRNESSILEYSIGCAAASSVLRSNLGLRGIISGGIIGAVLGTIVGIAFFSTLKAFDQTQEQKHYMEIYYDIVKKKEGDKLANMGRKVNFKKTEINNI